MTNTTYDIPKILGLYQAGDLKLAEIITRTYALDQVNEGYDDLLAGKMCAASWSASANDVPVQVVGHRRELEPVRAALASGARILLEGPPGTGRSTPLRQIAESRHTGFVLVEGSAELTPARLIRSVGPALVRERNTGRRPSPAARWCRALASPARWRRPRLWTSCRARSLR
jgi:hypothetical protein